MKIIILFIITMLPVFPAMAADPGLLPLRELVSYSPTPSQPDLSGASVGSRGPALNGDTSLARSLELSAADFLAKDDTDNLTGEFELKLPTEELPDSDIPLTLNSKVEYFVNYFQTSGRKSFARWLSRSERFIPMMKEVLRKEGMPEDLVYLAMIESGFSPHAYSVASAVGPWQFISGTGKRYSLRIDSWIDERRDPLKSTVAAALYLKELYAMFNNDWYLAAAGYNAGENKILRAIDKYNTRDFWQIAKGSYLARETKDYVPKLLAAAIIAKEPAKYGFADVAYLPPIEFDTVTIPSRTDLELVAKACKVTPQTIRELNPELRRWCTPPEYPGYELKVPKGSKRDFELEFAKIPEDQRYVEKVTHARYRVKKRDTLVTIARRFNTTPQVIVELNHLGRKSRIRGKVLTVPVLGEQGDSTAAVAVAKADKPARESSREFKKYYTVRKGDTLDELSRKFNVSAKILRAWNNLKGKLALRPGKRIIVAKYVEKSGSLVPVGGDKG